MGIKLTGHGNIFSKAGKTIEDVGKKSLPYVGAVAGGAVGFMLGGPAGLVIGASMGMSMTSQTQSQYYQQKYNREILKLQQQAYAQQSAELQRQRQIEIEQQKRENAQLMNAVTGLTDTSYGGLDSPSLSYDKYGDLG